MSGNRINDAWKGLRGQAEQDEARARIDWMVSHVEGDRILDVGCSQGIVAILLARQGRHVVGVDPDAGALAYAAKELAAEPESVRGRVQLVASGLESAEIAAEPFDGAVLGEILEHLEKPGEVLGRLFELLREGAQVVLTTPFGLFEHPDHKQTFYLSDFLLTVGPWLAGEALEIQGKYISYVGRRRTEARPEVTASELRSELGEARLVQLEHDALQARERAARRELEAAQQKRAGHYRALEAARQEIGDLQAALGEQSGRGRKGAEAAPSTAGLIARLRGERDEALRGAEAARAELEALWAAQNEQTAARDEAEQALVERLRTERDQLEKALGELRNRADAADRRRERAESRLQAFQSTNRYRVAQMLWEASRSPKQAVRLSGKLVRRVADETRSQGPSFAVHSAAAKVESRLRGILSRAKAPAATGVPAPAKPRAAVPAAQSASAVPRAKAAETGPGKAAAPRSAAPPPAGPAKAAPSASPALMIPGRATRVTDPKDLWVAAILDEMSAACFAPECHLIQPRPDDWREVLEARPPHLLFVESAWKGNDGAWQYKVGRYNHPDAGGLQELVEWCRERGIPTVFWNKEDPVHFDKFKEAAALFDHVFTTDVNSVPRYLALPGARMKTAAALPFAAQPRLHNPVSVGPRSDAPCFAGSYYGNRHHQRRAQQEALLDAARPFGLVLYDRNHGSESPDFRFPERFQPHIRGRLPYERLSREYKAHRIFLNVNSVVDSPTMLSRRVYELLASGTVVVSTPSLALTRTFGDLVPVADDAEQAGALIRRALEDAAWRDDLVRRGVRFVLSGHTYRHRLAQVAKTCGLLATSDVAPALSAALVVDSDDALGRALTGLAAQSRPVTDVLLGVDGGLSPERVAHEASSALPGAAVRVVARSQEDEDLVQTLARMAQADWVLLADADTALPAGAAEDLAACTAFAEADVIGPGAGDDAHRFAATLTGGPLLVRREVLDARGRPEGDLSAWAREGVRLYLAPLGAPALTEVRRAAG